MLTQRMIISPGENPPLTKNGRPSCLRGMWLCVTAVVLASFVDTVELGAQETAFYSSGTSSTARARTNAQAVIERGRQLLDDQRLDSTRALVSEYLRVGRMPIAERRELLQLAAASSYVSGDEGRTGEARSWLQELVRLDPDAAILREYSSPELDSLLADVKRGTFGAAVRFQSRYELVGTRVAGRAEVVATRPARFKLFVNRRGFEDRFLMDSTEVTTRGTLRLTAHDGERALLSDGLFEFQVVAYDSVSGDSVAVPLVVGQAQGAEPMLMDLPPTLSEQRLLPEWRPPARVEGLAYGIIGGVMAGVIGQYARGSAPIRSEGRADGRARSIGLLVGLAAGVAGWFDRGRPIRENIAANAVIREQYEREARFARRYNESWIANFRVVLLLDTEEVR
jgi:hypothetical protein